MKRIDIFRLALICLFFLLGLGLFKLQAIQGKTYRQLSYKNCIRLLPKIGARGRILDNENNVIVDNKLYYDLVILPQALNQPEKVLREVSGILGVSFNSVNELFTKSRFSSLPVTIAENIDLQKVIALEELRVDSPGIIIQPQPRRHYPHSVLASHVVGYVSEIDRWRLTKLTDYGYNTKDLVGFGGVEEKYDYYLRQEEGGSSVEVDHLGRMVRLLGVKPPSNGRDIQLTINLRIQKIVEDNLIDRTGCIVIMDPYSGQITAMASSPAFDPGIFVKKDAVSLSGFLNDPDAPLLNRATSASYPAGSIFKLIVAAAALEMQKINPSTSFLCQGSLLIGSQKFGCWDTHYQQDIIQAIAHSCNVFFFRVGLLAGAQAIHDYAVRFGLSKTSSFELPYETSGFIPSPLWRKIYKFKNWYDGDTANLSIGQGEVLVTPLQMTRMMAVFANGGYLVTPYIVKSVDGKDISASHKKRISLRLKEKTIELINRGLKETVSDPKGTANVLAGLPVSIAGKTGTAQAPPGDAHGWFICYFPYREPKYVVCVLLERAGAGYYSCLLAKRVIEKMIEEGLL